MSPSVIANESDPTSTHNGEHVPGNPSAPHDYTNDNDAHAAARLIQKNYRGHRERRELRGLGLNATSRWSEAIREAQWRSRTTPLARAERTKQQDGNHSPELTKGQSSAARQNWKRVGEVARRAGHDDTTDTESDLEHLSEYQRAEHLRKRAAKKQERERTAKMMDLQYFLEMVDPKHRYGSNLRTYHEEWRKADTHENFFHWLDHGDGRLIETATVTREKLEKERVRYLSREERMHYLVKIDDEGKLCWAKNGERINTTMDYMDSPRGIVPTAEGPGQCSPRRSSSSSGSSSSMSSGSSMSAEGDHYVNHELDQAQGIRKLKHVSAATIFNRLLRGTVKPNSWIFVADTSFRLYVGIKQSGAFQHSSFLHGARISAAGTLKIKDGQLRRLSPLSGHYRPPASSFRAFVHSLKKEGVDMSHMTISRSYAVLVGLEAYTKTRKKIKHGFQHTKEHKEKMIHPEEVKKKEEEQKDHSESAQMERQILAKEAEEEEKAQVEAKERQRQARKEKKDTFLQSIKKRIKRLSISSKHDIEHSTGVKHPPLSAMDRDVESGIPPEGHR